MKKAFLLIAGLINLAASAVYIACSPADIVPTHWNYQGVADGFMPKWTMMIMPIINLLYGITAFVIEIVMSKRGEGKNLKYVRKIFLALFLFAAALSWLFLPLSMRRTNNIGCIVNSAMLLLLGALIVFMGNLLPKVSQNGWLGVRTSSTLSNETVWRKTHRLAGYLGVGTGLLMIVMGAVNAALGIDQPYLILRCAAVILITLALIPSVYAARLSKKLNSQNQL